MEQYKILQPKEGVTLLAVKVPEYATSFEIIHSRLIFNKEHVKEWDFMNSISLPFDCKLLGIATEIPEEVWQGVMPLEEDTERYQRFMSNDMFNSYGGLIDCGCDTATESAMSFLEANEVYSEKPDDCPNQWCDGGKIDMGYNEYLSCELCEKAEANTGTWVILQRV